MKLGIYLNAQHPAGDDPARRVAETLEQVRLIRSLGFDSIWGGEHHVTPGFHYFPLLPMLQRVAAEAEGMWLGTNLVLLPLHNPVELAEVGAFLDMITGGRFLLGVGLGYRAEEFAVFGVSMAERVSRLVEGVEKYAAYLSWGIPGITLDPSAPPEVQLRRLAADRFAVGSPAQVVEALLRQHRAGVTHACMRVSWPGMPQADILAGIELLRREVVPEVRRRASAHRGG